MRARTVASPSIEGRSPRPLRAPARGGYPRERDRAWGPLLPARQPHKTLARTRLRARVQGESVPPAEPIRGAAVCFRALLVNGIRFSRQCCGQSSSPRSAGRGYPPVSFPASGPQIRLELQATPGTHGDSFRHGLRGCRRDTARVMLELELLVARPPRHPRVPPALLVRARAPRAASPLAFWWIDTATVYALSLVLIASVYIGFAVADGRWLVITNDLRRHRRRGRHAIAMAARSRPGGPRAQGSLAAPKSFRCEHPVVAPVLPRSRLGGRHNHCRRDRGGCSVPQLTGLWHAWAPTSAFGAIDRSNWIPSSVPCRLDRKC
jgi:hypothetical protein